MASRACGGNVCSRESRFRGQNSAVILADRTYFRIGFFSSTNPMDEVLPARPFVVGWIIIMEPARTRVCRRSKLAECFADLRFRQSRLTRFMRTCTRSSLMSRPPLGFWNYHFRIKHNMLVYRRRFMAGFFSRTRARMLAFA